MKIENKEYKTVVTTFLVSEEKPIRTLLVHHKKYNLWMPPGGHALAREDYCETAIREVREETGIDISKKFLTVRQDDRASELPLPYSIQSVKNDSHGEREGSYLLNIIYLIRIPFQKSSIKGYDEIHSVKWFTSKECEDIVLFDNTRLYLKKIFSEI